MHFECRLRREAVHNAGLRDAIDLTSFDFDYFWNRQLQFRGLNKEYSIRYLGGVNNVLELWQRTRTIQGMMIATRDRIVRDARERTFPRKRLVSSPQGWRLVQVTQQVKLAHRS
jgi:hypothetical protein